jgi:peptidoglycan/LPS O-acetylase OafA/YrhL
MSLFFAVVLILALTDSQGLMSRVMRWKRLANLGEIGYGVYLFHLGIYCICMSALAVHGWSLESWWDLAVTLIALAATIGFCKTSYRYFEKPIMKWGHTWQY